MEIPVTIKELADLDQDTLEAGILCRLITNPIERCQVLWIQPSDFTNAVAARVFTLVMETSANTLHCSFCAVEQELARRADFAAVKYLTTVVVTGGQPYSVEDLLKCSILLHDRALISDYNHADGERATQAWVDSVEASIGYDPREIADWPEQDDE
jgi:hypothetical protein